MRPEEISEARFAQALSLAGLPDPDLYIRTGGERRISNFLLWQLAYAELYFTRAAVAGFRDRGLERGAAPSLPSRERRFGQRPAAASAAR